MKSAIEKIFYGELARAESLELPEEYRKCFEVVAACDDGLTALLRGNKKALELLERFQDAISDGHAIEVVAVYKEGFRNGFRLALDAMEDD